MRVTLAMTYSKMASTITRKQEELDRVSDMVTTGKKMRAASDDPVAWSDSMSTRQGLREIASFKKNMEFATGWGERTSLALSQMGDLVTQARNLGMQAVSASTQEERDALQQGVAQAGEEMFNLSKSEYAGAYIFSGRSTTTPPFESGDYTYQGDTDPFSVRIGKNVHETVNMDGASVFLLDPNDPNTNILKTVDDLETAIQTGNTTQIQDLLGVLSTAHEHITSKESTMGARLASLENKQYALEDLELSEEDRLSQVDEADMAEAITNMQLKTTTLQAALKSASMVTNLNLSQYI